MNDQFPIGMRVLAVDDDRTCLKILEKLLQRCQYHGMLHHQHHIIVVFVLF